MSRMITLDELDGIANHLFAGTLRERAQRDRHIGKDAPHGAGYSPAVDKAFATRRD
jgi:hypothetical protein